MTAFGPTLPKIAISCGRCRGSSGKTAKSAKNFRWLTLSGRRAELAVRQTLTQIGLVQFRGDADRQDQNPVSRAVNRVELLRIP